MRTFLYLAVLVSVVSVIVCQSGYGRRRTVPPPVTQPGCYGSCVSWLHTQQCANGYSCRNRQCCPDPQDRCYGSCFSGSQCANGYSCSNYRCCPDEPNCRFCGGIAAVQCPSGYDCIYDGNFPDAGGCCRINTQNDLCPAPSNWFTTCQFDPRRNCVSNSQCPSGYICCPDGCGKVCRRIQYQPPTY